ncbi:leucine-rich repeat domain-containing protein [Psychroserpens ponticola]|uniref:Leucine-rich repeat domain-containing protein n=1 Tax=Psychroserpens ponticola TaxID=2932268 RepID=A0ABY7S595_9FLAO|nr:leucine-rich repeat domain-containing protein [Psychroserpens ponticola]WCO03586.1 leucine-rich repeat domain-containing protein [Psychroserpens ponticola]
MRLNLLILLMVINLSCVKGQSQKKIDKKANKEHILPLKIKIRGQLKQIEDSGLIIPSIEFNINRNYVKVKVGANEFYNTKYENTSFSEIFKLFVVDDFKSNEYFYNPYFKYMGYLETSKEIADKEYKRKFSNFKRKDIKINYLELDSTEIRKFTVLSNYINEIAIEILQESIQKDSMIVANSISEALKKPKKIYELSYRNSSTTILSPEIGKLTNLRVLDISGSQIKIIPLEIENCIHLKSIIANASQLSKVPNSIGNLKKLRNINFSYCKLKELPEEFGKLESLWNLSLGSNQLDDLPESFTNLKNLQMLNISNNNFYEFPREVLSIESVGNLWMHGNRFKQIPSEIVNLKGLHHFLVDVTEIDNIEEIKSLIPKVRIIDETNRR